MIPFKSFDEILASMKDSIREDVPDLDTREGSYTDTVIRASAMEIAQCYLDMQALEAVVFPDENSGIYIDKEANRFGVYRKDGVKATAKVTFSGADGVVVPAGTAVQTLDGLVYYTDAEAIVVNGSAEVAVTAERTGAVYNVPANAILTLQNSAGVLLESATAAAGGIDDEVDAALLKRSEDRRRRPATSGNAYHYEQWALEVEGIGAVRVIPTWRGGGTTKVIVLDSNMEPPAEALVTAVDAHIQAQRPIGADVTVVGAVKVPLRVEAAVQLDDTLSRDQVRETFRELLTDYCRDLAFRAQSVIYHRIAYMLLSIPGVVDFTALTINGGRENIPLAADAAPVVEEVVVQ